MRVTAGPGPICIDSLVRPLAVRTSGGLTTLSVYCICYYYYYYYDNDTDATLPRAQPCTYESDRGMQTQGGWRCMGENSLHEQLCMLHHLSEKHPRPNGDASLKIDLNESTVSVSIPAFQLAAQASL